MRRQTLGALALVPALAFTLQACGGDGGGAGAGSTAKAASDDAKLREFAQCMRENGVDMPDPKDGRIEIRASAKPGAGGAPKDSGEVEAAQKKCAHLMPNGGKPRKPKPEDLAKMRAFSMHARPRRQRVPRPEARRNDAAQGRSWHRHRPGEHGVQGRAEGVRQAPAGRDGAVQQEGRGLVARTRTIVLGAAGVVVVAGVSLATVGLGGGGDPAAAHSTLPRTTAPIERTTLVETQDVDGTLGYGDTHTVTGAGHGTLTWLAGPGTVISGVPVYRVDNKPVPLLYGKLPLYRTLSQGKEGADVKQFERNLRALGYTGFTVDDTYSAATVAAVKRWQDDLGVDETGRIEPGAAVVASGRIRWPSGRPTSATGSAAPSSPAPARPVS